MILFIENNFEKDFLSANKDSSGKTMSYLGSMLAHEVKILLQELEERLSLLKEKGLKIRN